MREIKVRAWYMPFGPKGPMQEMVYSKASSILAFAEMSPDKYIVEQYTDLKDINDIMIYEGDIVKNSYAYAQPRVSQIFMEDGNTYISGEDVATGGDMLLSDFRDSIEVIGDIHRNHKLLEVPHD